MLHRRKIYDTTGSMSESEQLGGQSFDDLYSFYRSMFAKVTEEDIEKVRTMLPSACTLRTEVLALYTRRDGSLACDAGRARLPRL